MRARNVIALAGMLLLGARGVAADETNGSGATGNGHAPELVENVYVIGDDIELHVLGYEDELDGIYHVESDGAIQLPFIGRIPAAGLSISEFEGQLTERVWRYYINKPQVTIQPLHSITVLGQVFRPGNYPVRGGEKLSTLLGMAGGTRDGARIEAARVQRGPTNLKRDLKRALESGRTVNDIGIESGDVIFIPSRPWYRDWRNWATIVSAVSVSFAVYDRVSTN